MAMKVSVNDREVAGTAPAGSTLEDLIDDLRRRGEIASDEIVASLAVDSRPWASGDMERLPFTPLDGLSEITITTDDMAGYARRILADASNMLSVLRQASDRIAAELRGREPRRANTNLFQLLDAIQQFLACLYNVRNSCAPQAQLLDSRRAVMSLLSAALDGIVECQEREDWPALATQIERYLGPALDGFEDIIVAMTEQV